MQLDSKMRSFYIFSVFLLLVFVCCNECIAVDRRPPQRYIYDNRAKTTDNEWREIFEFIMRFDLLFYGAAGRSCLSYKGYVAPLHPDLLHEKTSNTSTLPSTTPINDQDALYKLLEYLEYYPPYTDIYVITFATASWDEGLVEKILEQIQIKRSQVNFLIQGEYPSQVDYLEKYRLVTSISNGVTWTSFKLNQFTKWESRCLNFISPKANLLTIYGTDNGTYCMKTDSLLTTNITDMIFSSFDPNEYEITTSEKAHHQSTHINTREKVVENGVQKITPTEVCVEVRRKSQNSENASFYSLRGFSESDFDFDYGFSTDDVASLNETYRRPIKGKLNKIYVTPCLKYTPYGFDHFKILFLNGTSSRDEIPLEYIPNIDLFVGSFEPPNKEYFYIQVVTNGDGELISRMSSTAMNAADEFGGIRNPTFEHKPTNYRVYQPLPRPTIQKPTIQRNPAEVSKSKYNVDIYTVALLSASVGLLIVLPFVLAVVFQWNCLLPKRFQRRRATPEPLGIGQARRRAVPNNYYAVPVQRV